VASIQIYFEGARFFLSQGGGGRSPRPDSGDGVLGEGAVSPLPTSHQLVVWGSAVSSPSRVRGRTPGKFEIWFNLRKFTTEAVRNAL